MTRAEIQYFIEEMEAIGDIWTEEEVERCYGADTLEYALSTRKAEVGAFLEVLEKANDYLSNKDTDLC